MQEVDDPSGFLVSKVAPEVRVRCTCAETAGCPDSQRWCTGVGDALHFLLLEFDGLAAGDSQSISANTLEKNVDIILTGDKSTHVCS